MHFFHLRNHIMIFYNFQLSVHEFLLVFVDFHQMCIAMFLFAYSLVYNTYLLFFISFQFSGAFFLLLFCQIRVYY